MKLNASISITLDEKQKSEALVKILLEDYHSLAVEAQYYGDEMEKRILESFEIDDANNTLAILKAMDAVLENYMEPEHYENFKKAYSKTRFLYRSIP